MKRNEWTRIYKTTWIYKIECQKIDSWCRATVRWWVLRLARRQREWWDEIWRDLMKGVFICPGSCRSGSWAPRFCGASFYHGLDASGTTPFKRWRCWILRLKWTHWKQWTRTYLDVGVHHVQSLGCLLELSRFGVPALLEQLLKDAVLSLVPPRRWYVLKRVLVLLSWWWCGQLGV